MLDGHGVFTTVSSQGFIDLSGTLGAVNANGFRAGQIFDPATGDGTAAHPRTPFTNNLIPIKFRVNPKS